MPEPAQPSRAATAWALAAVAAASMLAGSAAASHLYAGVEVRPAVAVSRQPTYALRLTGRLPAQPAAAQTGANSNVAEPVPTQQAFSTAWSAALGVAAIMGLYTTLRSRHTASSIQPLALASMTGKPSSVTMAPVPLTGAHDVDAASRPLGASAEGATEETTYHFLVANAKFMLFDEEQAMELLREKRRFLREKGLPQDFWIVPEPEFLSKLPDIDERVLKPSCALVSTDERWIVFMKLRYDKVLMGSFRGPSDPKKALATKGGDALAVVPKWEVPADWAKTVPYPKYADDWFHVFLVDPPK